MLRCDCLRRKVLLLKNKEMGEGSAPPNHTEENGTKVKKKKNRRSYSKYAFIRLEVNEK